MHPLLVLLNYLAIIYLVIFYSILFVLFYFVFSYSYFGLLTHETFNMTLFSNETAQLSETFNSITLMFKWQQCCTDAILCCINYHKKYHDLLVKLDEEEKQLHNQTSRQQRQQIASLCPPTWDGWLCWDEFAQPNQMLERSCPKHIYWHQLVPPCRGELVQLLEASML